MTSTKLFKIVILSAYTGGVPFRVYPDGGHVIHGHMFDLYFGKKCKFKHNVNLN